MELRDALTQISQIRQQVAQTEVFRGYRALPVAFSGILAMATAGFQAVWLPDPAQNIGGVFAKSLSLGPLTFRHEPTQGPADGQIAGHLHASARVTQRGRSVTRPCGCRASNPCGSISDS